MLVIDLSVPLDERTAVYQDPRGYSDPLTRFAPWIEIGETRGGFVSPYRVTLLQLGAHTGTHLDVGAHFHLGGQTVTDVPTQSLAGWAVVIDLSELDDAEIGAERFAPYRARASADGATPLIITADDACLSPSAAKEIVSWRRPLMVLVGGLDGDDLSYPLLGAILGAGVALATGIDPARARLVQDGDLLIVAPLPLTDLEGAPCRVLAIRGPRPATP